MTLETRGSKYSGKEVMLLKATQIARDTERWLDGLPVFATITTILRLLPTNFFDRAQWDKPPEWPGKVID